MASTKPIGPPPHPSQKSEKSTPAKGKLNNRTITPLRAGLGAAGAATIAIAAAIFTTPGAIPALLTLAASGPIGWGIIGLGAVTALGVIAVAGVTAYLGTEVLIDREERKNHAMAFATGIRIMAEGGPTNTFQNYSVVRAQSAAKHIKHPEKMDPETRALYHALMKCTINPVNSPGFPETDSTSELESDSDLEHPQNR